MSDTRLNKPQDSFNKFEEAYQESERRFLAVWESAADAMALSTSDGTVIAANPAYFQLYGYSPDEVIGKNYSIIFPPEQRAWAQELYEYVFQSPAISPSFVTPIRRADGTERIVESRYSFLTRQGKRYAMLSIVRDITAQQRAGEALRESELKLHLALEVGQMGSWTWDIVSNTIHCSANMQAALGFPPEMSPLTYEMYLERVHPQDRARIDHEIKRALEQGADYRVELRVVRADGSMLWTKTYGQVISDEAGKPIRVIGISRDMTTYKQNKESEQPNRQ
jgi:PAS domain S-box-containing protein